jgi:hypothetical protein
MSFELKEYEGFKPTPKKPVKPTAKEKKEQEAKAKKEGK